MKYVRTAALVGTVTLVSLAILIHRKRTMGSGSAQCGEGFSVVGTRCCVSSVIERCTRASICPTPLVARNGECLAPIARVKVPAQNLVLSATDWETEGKVPPKLIQTREFYIDAFELTVGDVFCPSCPLPDPARDLSGDRARAASALTLDEAAQICRSRGGRLPTGDEWIAAALPTGPRRYPWGDTGAVCRRAAWGLLRGPCGASANGPDTVGAHPDGAVRWPGGVIYDLAGNVAEWVQTPTGVAHGGSWASDFAADIRVWNEMKSDPNKRDARIGARCAYETSPGASKDP